MEGCYVLRRDQKLRHCQRRGGAGHPDRLRLHQSLQELLPAPDLGLLLRPAFTAETEDYLLSLLSPGYINGLTLLGGDALRAGEPAGAAPLPPPGAADVSGQDHLGLFRLTYEELTTDGTHPRCEVTDEMLSLLDVLVDGRFVEELKDLTLRFRGSSNQAAHRPERQPGGGASLLLPDRSEAGSDKDETPRRQCRRGVFLRRPAPVKFAGSGPPNLCTFLIDISSFAN